VRADENPTTADLPQKLRNPKKDQKEEEKYLDLNKKRTGRGGGRRRASSLPLDKNSEET
jgi:hypothetical protein